MKDPYIAHFREENDEVIIQSVLEHNSNVALLSEKNSSLEDLSPIAWLIGILHDAGKYQDAFQKYIKKNMDGEKTYRGEVNHSTAGGFLLEQFEADSMVTQMMEFPIYCHHGIADALAGNGKVLVDERLKQKENVQQVPERFYQFIDRTELESKFYESRKRVSLILNALQKYALSLNKSERNLQKNFFVGMYERILLSLLIDADWSDTSCFMQNDKIEERVQEKREGSALWAECKEHFMGYVGTLSKESKLSEVRAEILKQCMLQGKEDGNLYRLTVPTGSGKTFSSLGFALSHAEEHNKKHIIYVAPFTSILEQNAEEIRKAIGNSEMVLEHHSNIFYEREEDQKRYELLSENWSSPVIVTTAVQFLNTLFSSFSKNIRRMNNICNSVIIFDEIQALPIRTMKMFNLAMNFLTVFGKSTVVLCSATQPLLDRLLECRLNQPRNMVEPNENYEEIFKRTTIRDATNLNQPGCSIEELGEFVLQKAHEEERVLVIVNTKRCAEKTYRYLKENSKSSGYLLFHLSTNMCPQNRQDILNKIKKKLKETDEKIICITTQLIEAGVDISFRCVIRSLAGLDSIVQAAGRCNRNKEVDNGNVYIVRMAKEAENVGMLKDIVKAQEAMQRVLYQFEMQPSALDNCLDSAKAIQLYYQFYMNSRKEEMSYLVSIDGRDDTLLNLLSGNRKVWSAFEKNYTGSHTFLKQAFKSAGDLFEVIPEDGKVDVVVEYDAAAKELIDQLRDRYISLNEQQQVLRKLQKYTVGISVWLKEELKNAITGINDDMGILILSENYYSHETGVSTEPVMEFTNF